MIHTSLPQNCMVFLLLCELIYESQKFDSHVADRVSRRGKRKTVQFRGMFVWIIVFYF
jgi:hypothetical protein